MPDRLGCLVSPDHASRRGDNAFVDYRVVSDVFMEKEAELM